MTKRFSTLPIFAVAGVLTLAACGGTPALDTPGFFSLRASDGVMQGRYNPAGYSKAEVQKLIAQTCPSAALSSYGEQPAETLVAFSARCKGKALLDGIYEFETAGNQVVVEGIVYDENGNLSRLSMNQSK